MQLSQADQYGCRQKHHVNTIAHLFANTTEQLAVQLAVSKNSLSISIDLLPVWVQILMLDKMKSAISKSFESLVHNFLEPHRLQLRVDARLCHTALSPLATLPEGAEISLYVTSTLTQNHTETREASLYWWWFWKSFPKWRALALKTGRVPCGPVCISS